MSISNDNEMKSRLMKMNTIMDELYNPDGSHGMVLRPIST